MPIRFALLAACLLARTVSAQALLSKADAILAKTCLGTTEVRSVSVEVSRNVVIAFLGDTLRTEELPQLRHEVGALSQAIRNTHSLRVAWITGNSVKFEGPFKTSAQAQAALAELANAVEIPEPLQPIGLYSSLGKLAPELGADWSSVFIVGHLPAIDAEMLPFTSAWLATQFRSAKVRVGYWMPSGEKPRFWMLPDLPRAG